MDMLLQGAWERLVDLVFTHVPLGVWIALGAALVAVVAGIGWRFYALVGWRGMVAGLGSGVLAIVALLTYRQGYRHGRAKAPPMLPVEDAEPAPAPKPRRRGRLRPIWDVIGRRRR